MNGAEIIIALTVFLTGVSAFLFFISKRDIVHISPELYKLCFNYYKKEVKWLYYLIGSFVLCLSFCALYCILIRFDLLLILFGFLYLSTVLLSLSGMYFNKRCFERYKKRPN